ncbi:MAG: diacylglycerol kinase [Ostreibacterium sp.]
MHKPTNNTGIKRLLNAVKFSSQGFIATFRSEAAFRQECYLGIVLIPLSFFIADNIIEWILLIISFLVVLLAEMINSSIEAIVDRFGFEHHPLSGKAKDAGSAAVSIALIIALVTWLTIIFF